MTNGLTDKQVEFLLRPIHSSRVLRDNKGMAHVSQQDIRAHLNRIFGFAGWTSDVKSLDLVAENRGKDRDGKDKGWAVTYRAHLRLTVKNPAGAEVAHYEDVATGTSPNLPTLGDAHDFACKVAVSMALKRAATNLGDGFGLSLYNKGQTSALVIDTIVKPAGEGQAVDEIEPQVSMGHDDAGSQEPEDRPASHVQGDASETTDWNARKPHDPEWVKAWEQQVGQAETTEQWQQAWRDLTAEVKAGALTDAQAADLKQLWQDAVREQQVTNEQRAARQEASA